MNSEESLEKAAMKADMHEDTARKYLKAGKTPDELKQAHTWQTRVNPFEKYWKEITSMLELNPGLEAKTIFEHLQVKYPDEIRNGQLRTLQRKIKQWRILESNIAGPEVFFVQEHIPGKLSQSDFTHMDDLGIMIGGELFRHMLYHFVLTFSNWEDGTVCYSESGESLSEGIQNALWKLGGVPYCHQTDQLTAAVQQLGNQQEFTKRYMQLMKHYGMEGRKTQAYSPNENGDIEQRHHRFKRKIEQQLMLRGSKSFNTLDEYKEFIANMFKQLNVSRHDCLQEELKVLRELPETRLENCKKLIVNVTPGSVIHIQKNIYSVNSRLIGTQLEVFLYADYLDVKYKNITVETIPRLRGSGKHTIQYRHIIDWLIRKPGAFENYKYKQDLFPTTYFRIAYDKLVCDHAGKTAVKQYLKLLYLAAKTSEAKVNQILKQCIEADKKIDADEIRSMSGQCEVKPKQPVDVALIDLTIYEVLCEKGVSSCLLN
jgi:hypothetical protein